MSNSAEKSKNEEFGKNLSENIDQSVFYIEYISSYTKKQNINI